MKWHDGRHQFARRVPPKLGPLENVERPFFVAPPVPVRAAAGKRLSPLPRRHALSKPASSRWGTETRWSNCAHPRYRTRLRDTAATSASLPEKGFRLRLAALRALDAHPPH